ncbi:hypothetical protein OUZ56_005564 [Daphnia magna]|uniref:Uncharacterized protein n=1 Tax=Daphnia magna TaxID=35525 RepID=A0ABQ9YT43_9CRUS|nr:hypothetical protein OUZ56_005564 [Daphnia magna]
MVYMRCSMPVSLINLTKARLSSYCMLIVRWQSILVGRLGLVQDGIGLGGVLLACYVLFST